MPDINLSSDPENDERYPYHEGIMKAYAYVLVEQSQDLTPKNMDVMDPVALSLKVFYYDSIDNAYNAHNAFVKFCAAQKTGRRSLVCNLYRTNLCLDIRRWTLL